MAKGYQPKQRRIPRETRQNLRLWAEGARDTILRPHIEPYADALDRGWKAERDYHRAVCSEYHVRISWRLKDYEDPPLPLSPFDPIAIQELEDLTPTEEIARLARIKVLDARIRRWLKYRVKKLRKLHMTKLDFRKNPYAVLLSKLSGITTPPKARQAYQQFMHECYATRIDPVVKQLWRDGNKDDHSMANTQPNAAFRAKVSRDMFKKLPPDEQVEFSKKAKAVAAKAKDEYEKQMTRPVSLAPEDLQQCIDNIPNCVGPLIQGIQERTKFKFFLMFGGPTPRNNGEITAYHLNFGRNIANQPIYYSSFKQDLHENYTHARWVDFLKTCYTDKDLKLTALSTEAKPAGVDASDSESEESDSSLPSESDSEPLPPKKRKKISKKASVPPKPPQPSAGTTILSNSTASSSAPPNNASLVAHPTSLPAASDPSKLTPTATLGTTPASAGSPASRATASSLLNAPVPRAPSTGYLAMLKRGGKLQQLRSVSAAPVALGDRQHIRSANETLPPSPILPPRSRSADPYAMDVDKVSLLSAPSPSFQIPRPPSSPAVQPSPASMESQPPPRKKRKVVEPSGVTRAYLNMKADSIQAVSSPTTIPSATTHTSTPALPSSLSSPPHLTLAPNVVAATMPSPRAQTISPSPPSHTSELPSQGRASPAPSALTLMCPPEAAETWFADAFASLTQQDLGHEFSATIRTFTAIETSYNYLNPSKGLGACGRPSELTRWIASGRWRGKMPTVDNPIKFAAAWWAWWSALQPPWRQFSADGRPTIAVHGNDWKVLSFPGQNGILSILVTLYWWGCAVATPEGPRHGPGSVGDWQVAVWDLSWMLDGLLLNLA